MLRPSWGYGEPFDFQLGAGMVIPGWDQGVEARGSVGVGGTRIGARRQLVVPPSLA
jgi:peptidylprolyl isomerase